MQNQFINNLNPPPLDLSVDRYSAWRTWRKRWEDFYTITGLKNEEKSFVAATLRYTFTDETRRERSKGNPGKARKFFQGTSE